jgi:hypothetical protein
LGVKRVAKMVEINGTKYKLCLLDTNVASEMVKDRNDEFQKYFNHLFQDGYLPCFTVFSIIELRQKRELFSGFLDLFSVFPSVILKGHGQILEEEIENYPHYQEINPLSFSLVGMKPYKNLTKRQTTELLFKTEPFVSYSEKYLANRDSDLNEMIANSQTFLPEIGRYSKTEMWIYLQSFVLQQLFLKNREFVDRIKREEMIDINAFPSLLMMAYTVFYKFYEDRQRKPSNSDVFDIVISALVPYMDAVVIENNQAEAIKKTRNREKPFLSSVRILTLKELRGL